MRIVSWNTNGLRGTFKAGMWEPFLKAVHGDIICLQETKSEPEQLPAELSSPKNFYPFFAWSKVKKGYSGVAIYSKEKPERVTGLGIKKFDDEGRTLVAYYSATDSHGPFALINCYFPNGGGGPERLKYKLEFYKAFLSFVNELKEEMPVIFTGDVNTAHTPIDLARPKENETHTGFLPVERAWLDKVVGDGWIDSFRHLYPDTTGAYSYWDQKTGARARNVGWRIDYFFVSPDIALQIKQVEHKADVYGSDHCPVILDIDIP